MEGFWMLRRKKNPSFTRHKVKVLGHTRLLDTTKAQQELRYKPQYTCPTTITDTVSWYQASKVVSFIEAQ
jgi:nucleoside-diphosphate-sugar epimerase